MVDLKTLDQESLYRIWSDCCENKWPEIIGQKPEGFDNLISERKWHHIFAKRVKRDYLHPIGIAARGLISEEFLEAKVKEYWENIENKMYLSQNEAERILSLCYNVGYHLKWSEKKAIIEYCSKCPK